MQKGGAAAIIHPSAGGALAFGCVSFASHFHQYPVGDEINRHLCCQEAGRIIAALCLDVFERTVQAYTELGGE